MVKLKVSHLNKSFHAHSILHDVSLSAKKGEVVALLGRSGSGKSTLLRCINLLTVPDAGTIEIDEYKMTFGKNHPSIPAKETIQLRKKVGMVFQQFNLWAHMDVLANLIEAPIYVLKRSKQEAIEQAKKLLAKVGLANKLHAYPAQLSGGEQQRAAIARALMMQPEIMLFDEPTSALDPEMVGEVLSVMQNLAAEGMTMLIATHELNFARRVAHQVIFLDDGIILESGSSQEVFTHAKTERFQQFLNALQH